MYSRSYSRSNNVPPNYSGTSIEVEKQESNKLQEVATEDESEETNDVDVFANKPYARVPLMDKTEYINEISKGESIFNGYETDENLHEDINETKERGTNQSPKTGNEVLITNKKISSDDILLIGILIVLLGCENIDIKLILAIGILLFVGF